MLELSLAKRQQLDRGDIIIEFYSKLDHVQKHAKDIYKDYMVKLRLSHKNGRSK